MASSAKPARRSSGVLKLWRRGSKDVGTGPSEVSNDDIGPAPHSPSAKIGFFDLPAEIRNAIYGAIISDAVLTLPTIRAGTSWRSRARMKKNKSAPAPINGLLLASKQCRHEYITTLLSTAEVNVDIHDFDFQGLIRASSRLGPVESQALRSNDKLVISLATQNCTAKAMASLRRWLEFRASSDGRALAWSYRFPRDLLLPATSAGRIRLLRELEYYVDNIAALDIALGDGEQVELRRIVEAFESEIRWLDLDVGRLGQRATSYAWNVRGLAGGGLM